MPNEKFSEEATGLFKLFDKSLPSWSSHHDPVARCRTYRRVMDDLMTSLGNLSVNLRTLVLSHIEHVKTRQILALSSTFEKAFSLPGALPRTYDFEGVSGDDIVDLVDHLLDAVRAQTLEKVRALELIGDEKNRLCEYACRRNLVVLKWAHNELDLPWAPYPAGRVNDDVLVLRVLRESSLVLKRRWRENTRPKEWWGVKMVDGRVVELVFDRLGLCAVPAEIGQLTSLKVLNLHENQLTSVPAAIRELRAAGCDVYLDDGVTYDIRSYMRAHG